MRTAQAMISSLYCCSLKSNGKKYCDMPSHIELTTKLLPWIKAWLMDEELCPTKNADILALRGA